MSLQLDIPKVPTLTGLENLDEWDDILTRTLRIHGLADFIKGNVPEPTARREPYITEYSRYITGNNPEPAARRQRQWASDRAMVCLLIVGSFSSDVRDTLLAHGYNPEEENPRVIYELVIEAIPKAAGENIFALMQELGNISPTDFPSMRDYQVRLQYFRRRLNQTEPQPNDNFIMISTILGLARSDQYAALSHLLGRELERGALTWARLMSELAYVNGRELAGRLEAKRAPLKRDEGMQFEFKPGPLLRVGTDESKRGPLSSVPSETSSIWGTHSHSTSMSRDQDSVF